MTQAVTIPVSAQGLASLADLARRNGTQNAFIDMAVQWALQAAQEIDRLQAEVEALRAVLHRAGNELVCDGEVMSESDDEWTRSHACGRCDNYVDRGWPIRTEIRAALAAKSLMQEQPK